MIDMPKSSMDTDSLSGRLLRWYAENRRILPWREDPSPYHIWLSEIMLQQTRVEAAKKYYLRFLSYLPDIPSLAKAPESLYMKLWEGLGYYSRVRNLHLGAVQVMEEYGGRLPSRFQELKRIRGIGPYTAAAIASIAFHERVPAIDGNLLRVFARLRRYPENVRDLPAKKAAFSFFEVQMPIREPGDFNQALMDLGAMVCTPHTAPDCGHCPLTALCLSFLSGETALYPRQFPKRSRQIEKRTVFLIRDQEHVWIRQRPEKGLLAGLYEFPNVPGHLTETEAAGQVRLWGVHPLHIRTLPAAKHIFTHKEWHMIGYEIKAADGLREKAVQYDTEDRPFLLADLPSIREEYAFPSAFSAYMDCLLASAMPSTILRQ